MQYHSQLKGEEDEIFYCHLSNSSLPLLHNGKAHNLILRRARKQSKYNNDQKQYHGFAKQLFSLSYRSRATPSSFTQKMSAEEEVTDLICLIVFKHFVVSPCSSFLSPFSDAGKRKT